MRGAAVLAAAVLVVSATPAAAQVDAGGRVLDLELRVVDLQLRTEDLGGASRTNEKGNEVEIALSADVLFDFDRASLTPRANKTLREVARRIETEATGTVEITGYTDSKGPNVYNLRLSQRRAKTVERALGDLAGSADVTFVVKGRGEKNPVAPNLKQDGSDNPKGRALNRRVEVRFAKSD
jgi:outer membrane protein OmpA-like peptidoglycan-associated protein